MADEIPIQELSDHRASDKVVSLTFVVALTLVPLILPYGLLMILSLGSGWSFPHLLPDRVDFAPWRRVAVDQNGLLRAAATSLAMSMVVSLPSTCVGLVAGRSIRRSTSNRWRFIAYLPFVLSPVIVGTCLYDLMARLDLVSSVAGVVVCQSVFALAFATVLFSELWTSRIDRAEQVVATLGGSSFAVWRHAVLPQTSGLILVCLIQTGLYSWLDYGLVSLVGGGAVKTLTVALFSSIREANVNQAALSSLMLLFPVVLGYLITGMLLTARKRRESL